MMPSIHTYVESTTLTFIEDFHPDDFCSVRLPRRHVTRRYPDVSQLSYGCHVSNPLREYRASATAAISAGRPVCLKYTNVWSRQDAAEVADKRHLGRRFLLIRAIISVRKLRSSCERPFSTMSLCRLSATCILLMRPWEV